MNRHPWLGFGLVVLGCALATNSLLGPLAAGVVEYPLSRTLLNQTLGLEVASLVLVAPVSVAAGLLVLRGHPAGALLGLGPALYSAYMFVQYVVGPEYLEYPGVLTFHLGLFILAEVLAVRAWTAVDSGSLPSVSVRRERTLGFLLLVLAGFIVLRYLPGIVGSFTGEPLPADAREDPAMYWTIVLLDLGIVVPAALASGVALIAGRAPAWARKTAYAVVGWFALVGTAVAAMGVAMVLDDDPNASAGLVTVFSVTAVGAIVLALWTYRPLLDVGRPS
ncbi:MAG: hypothetical protein R3223_12230 [Longimicrobiales bacterium]|nr:hypothetical protein [Longimicrobiales bacterium]